MPLPASNGGPIRSTSRKGATSRDTARFTGGGAAADCARVTGSNILSVAYNAATGKYLVTFNTVGGTIGAALAQVHPLSAGPGVFARLVIGSFSASAKTIQLETYDAADAAVDLLTTDHLCIEIEWGQS